jgi:hypothetical protein
VKLLLAYLFRSLIIGLSVGPSTPFGGCSETEVALGGFSPAGVAEPSLEAFAAASAFAFLLFADLDSTAATAAEDAMILDNELVDQETVTGLDELKACKGSTVYAKKKRRVKRFRSWDGIS